MFQILGVQPPPIPDTSQLPDPPGAGWVPMVSKAVMIGLAFAVAWFLWNHGTKARRALGESAVADEVRARFSAVMFRTDDVDDLYDEDVLEDNPGSDIDPDVEPEESEPEEPAERSVIPKGFYDI